MLVEKKIFFTSCVTISSRFGPKRKNGEQPNAVRKKALSNGVKISKLAVLVFGESTDGASKLETKNFGTCCLLQLALGVNAILS